MAHPSGPNPILRINEIAESTAGHYRIEVSLEGAGPRRAITLPLAFEMRAQDRENLRWYLEDFLLFPHEPAPTIAAGIETRVAEIGDQLFQAIFQANDDARDLWAKLRDLLSDTRVEVITDIRHAASIPWELLRDSRTKTHLALEARAFVRSHFASVKTPRGARPMEEKIPIRILLVICRPKGGADVPFRSVAMKLLKSLNKAAREVVQLDVLRPPTFEQLSRVLRDAKDKKKPYHALHFDGHGAYLNEEQKKKYDVLSGIGAHALGGERKGAHGYLVFESADETNTERVRLVDGPAMGRLLVETGVPILVLNACRSAHAEPPPAPAKTAGDVHGDIESFGSLALELMDAGVSGVVAMRYNLFVVTAAQFIGELYEALVDGRSLGEAVTRGRKQLDAQPLRSLGFKPRRLQDWPVPVVYEVEPLPLFPAPVSGPSLKLFGEVLGEGLEEAQNALHGVPHAPDVGFIGRDEVLLALDRAFDRHRVVLLMAYAGSGKSSTAAEFARWYAQTGGVEGPVLWTSFTRRKPLATVLEELARVFGPLLKKNGIEWPSLSDAERKRMALQILKQVPVLWIWDNVEPVAGFPAGAASLWSDEEQRELSDFLREARDSRAKFLLSSRRDEGAWLGELPARIAMRGMRMEERVQLARALADKRGRRLEDVEDWMPLLAFTQGNPLTLTVLVRQALREGLKTKTQVIAFVDKLKAGAKAFSDEESEGRSGSLGASLRYGFEHAFEEEELRKLALLHLFQGFVRVGALQGLGEPKASWCLPELKGLSREAGMALLDRAADIGLLSALGGGFYSIHPAVPWFFRGIFESWYPESRAEGEGSNAKEAMRAFVGMMGELGRYCSKQYVEGLREHLVLVEAEESNLLYAWELAMQHQWWKSVVGTMLGLFTLYWHTGRQVERAKLVNDAQKHFVDPKTDGPFPGREEGWSFISGERVTLALQARRFEEAERLAQINIRWSREWAAPSLALPIEALNEEQKGPIRSLAIGLVHLGRIQAERGQRECVDSFSKAVEMAKRLGDRAHEAAIAFELGNAYMGLATIRNLEQAEVWYKRSLAVHFEKHRHDRAKCLGQLGSVALERFCAARAAGQDKSIVLDHLQRALDYHNQALNLLPPEAVGDLAVTHLQLGGTYVEAGLTTNLAMNHFQEAIRYSEQANDLFRAAHARYNAAIILARAGHLANAHAYALAALHNYETFGEGAVEHMQKTKNLLAQIEKALKAPASS